MPDAIRCVAQLAALVILEMAGGTILRNQTAVLIAGTWERLGRPSRRTPGNWLPSDCLGMRCGARRCTIRATRGGVPGGEISCHAARTFLRLAIRREAVDLPSRRCVGAAHPRSPSPTPARSCPIGFPHELRREKRESMCCSRAHFDTAPRMETLMCWQDIARTAQAVPSPHATVAASGLPSRRFRPTCRRPPSAPALTPHACASLSAPTPSEDVADHGRMP
jgi:hypothetical protein